MNQASNLNFAHCRKLSQTKWVLSFTKLGSFLFCTFYKVFILITAESSLKHDGDKKHFSRTATIISHVQTWTFFTPNQVKFSCTTKRISHSYSEETSVHAIQRISASGWQGLLDHLAKLTFPGSSSLVVPGMISHNPIGAYLWRERKKHFEISKRKERIL